MQHNLAQVTTPLLIGTSTTTVLVAPHKVKYVLTQNEEGAGDVSLTLPSTRRVRKVDFPSPPRSLDHKTVAHLILGPEPPCLPACIPHKHPVCINRFLAYPLVSRSIPSVLRHKEPELQ